MYPLKQVNIITMIHDKVKKFTIFNFVERLNKGGIEAINAMSESF